MSSDSNEMVVGSLNLVWRYTPNEVLQANAPSCEAALLSHEAQIPELLLGRLLRDVVIAMLSGAPSKPAAGTIRFSGGIVAIKKMRGKNFTRH
jgi:hypothetical protein